MTETDKCRDRLIRWCEGNGLDVGCGAGKIRPEAIGVDRRPFPHVQWTGDAAGALPFIDGCQDYVYSSHFLEHVAGPLAVLNEWLRVLKPGGHLVLYLPHKDLYKTPNPEHLQAFDIEAVLALLRKADYRTSIVHTALDQGEDRYSFEIVAKKEA